MALDPAQLDQALRRLHTPESFGRAVIESVLRVAKDRGDGEMEARIAFSAPASDGSIPVCFFLFDHEICVSIPVA